MLTLSNREAECITYGKCSSVSGLKMPNSRTFPYEPQGIGHQPFAKARRKSPTATNESAASVNARRTEDAVGRRYGVDRVGAHTDLRPNEERSVSSA